MPKCKIGRISLIPVICFLMWLVVMLMYTVSNVAAKAVIKKHNLTQLLIPQTYFGFLKNIYLQDNFTGFLSFILHSSAVDLIYPSPLPS